MKFHKTRFQPGLVKNQSALRLQPKCRLIFKTVSKL